MHKVHVQLYRGAGGTPGSTYMVGNSMICIDNGPYLVADTIMHTLCGKIPYSTPFMHLMGYVRGGKKHFESGEITYMYPYSTVLSLIVDIQYTKVHVLVQCCTYIQHRWIHRDRKMILFPVCRLWKFNLPFHNPPNPPLPGTSYPFSPLFVSPQIRHVIHYYTIRIFE